MPEATKGLFFLIACDQTAPLRPNESSPIFVHLHRTRRGYLKIEPLFVAKNVRILFSRRPNPGQRSKNYVMQKGKVFFWQNGMPLLDPSAGLCRLRPTKQPKGILTQLRINRSLNRVPQPHRSKLSVGGSCFSTAFSPCYHCVLASKYGVLAHIAHFHCSLMAIVPQNVDPKLNGSSKSRLFEQIYRQKFKDNFLVQHVPTFDTILLRSK